MTWGELGRTVLALGRRRWGWLLVVAAGAGLVAVPAGVVLGWLSPAADARLSLRWTLGLWLALTGAGAVLVALVDRRPGRRVTLAALGAIAALLVCAVPAGTFWAFAVDHGQAGAACPECAVTTYLAAGPLGGYARDDLTFRAVLCDGRRAELERQAAALAADVATASVGAGVTFLEAEPSDVRGGRVDQEEVTVVVDVALRWAYVDRQPGGTTGTRLTSAGWAFGLVEDDGWRVCRLDAPALCGALLSCDPASSAPAATPSATPSDDPLRHPREMLPCGPRDPFRELHTCSPTATPS